MGYNAYVRRYFHSLSPHCNWGACRKLLAFKGVQVRVPPAPSPTAQGRWSWDAGRVGAPTHSWLPCWCWGTWPGR